MTSGSLYRNSSKMDVEIEFKGGIERNYDDNSRLFLGLNSIEEYRRDGQKSSSLRFSIRFKNLDDLRF